MDDKDREAYERGQTQREYDDDISPHGIMWSLFAPRQDPGDSDSEQSAFDKVSRGEQLDEDKGSGGCFLTTACVESVGLHDNCYELTILRKFRDTYVIQLPDGHVHLDEYYRLAPLILIAINTRHDREAILQRIYQTIQRVILLIEQAQFESAFFEYQELFKALKVEFIANPPR